MAPQRKFGCTWWGARWLKAIELVDDANRLPRGRSYAAQDHVIRLELVPGGGAVEALVEGSAYLPYEVRVAMTPVPERSAQRLVTAVAEDPDLVATLLDGELPEGIAALCEELGIELFPRSWRSMRLSCSCPDPARVCKHIAAVFCIMADRIDVDPFFIFRFRGIDLKASLARHGIDIDHAVRIAPFTPESVLACCARELDAAPESSCAMPAGTDADAGLVTPEAHALGLLRTLPYSSLSDLTPALLPLLPQKTPVTGSLDVRGFVDRLFGRVRRETARRLSPVQEESLPPRDVLQAFLESVLGEDLPPDLVDGALQGTVRPVTDLAEGDADPSPGLVQTTIGGGRPKILALEGDRLFPALAALPPDTVRLLAPEFECWREIGVAAFRLLEKGAFIPTVVRSARIRDAAPRIWWTPALRDPSVRALVARLACGITPWAEGLVTGRAGVLCNGVPERIAVLCLSAAARGLVARAAEGWPPAERASGILELGLLGADLSPLDGRLTAEPGEALARAFRPLSLGDAYPWRPVLTVRTAPDRCMRLNFGIIGREANLDAATETELARPEESAGEAASGAGMPAEGGTPPVPLDRPVLLRRLLRDPRWAPHRFAALSVLKTLAGACPALDAIRTGRGTPAVLPLGELRDFLFETSPLLTLLGVTLMLPQSLRRILRPTLSASAGAGQGFAKSLLTKDAIADFDWRAAIGGRVLTPEEFEDLARHAGEIVQFEENFVYLDPDEIARIRRTLETPPELSPLERMRAVLTGEIEGAPVEVSDGLRTALRRITEVKDVPPPSGLRATLRPYQERGFCWLMKNLSLGMGALIADDMGLGKTLQVISAMLELKNRGELVRHRILAVVPTTLLANWTRELGRFAPALTVGIHHGAFRRLPDAADLPDVTLTSYGTLRRDFEALSAVRWRLLVLDEAQAVKNVSASQTAAVRGIRADAVIAMTGTPVENRLMEYWSVLSAVQPRILGTQKDFIRTFAKPIEADHDERAAEAFRRLTAPFMLRRLKTDRSVISDLPEKNTIDRWADMTPEQAALYAVTLEKLMKRLHRVEADPEADRMVRRGVVLQMITSLKQICNSPSQFGHVTVPRPDSGKAEALLEILGQCREADRKVLVFTQYREMGERLQKWIETMMGEHPEFLHGGVPVKERARMVDRFQEDRSARILILSLKAGGTGLNLTAASAVVHYDLWWNPAVEAQATDRAFRIGQRRDVLVYRLITAGSFEERINDMLEAKRGLAEMTVTTGESWIGDLPADELERIFSVGTSSRPAAPSA